MSLLMLSSTCEVVISYPRLCVCVCVDVGFLLQKSRMRLLYHRDVPSYPPSTPPCQEKILDVWLKICAAHVLLKIT